MRYPLFLLFALAIGTAASTSPRYQILADSTAEKKPIGAALKSTISEMRASANDSAANATASEAKPKKGLVTTIVLPEPPVDSLKILFETKDSIAPSALRSIAATHVLFDSPEIPATTMPRDSGAIEMSSPTNAVAVDTVALVDSAMAYNADTSDKAGDKIGFASWYGPGLQGRKTSSGELFDMNKMTAAHRTLPFGTIVEVINLKTGQAVKVRVNDRGPHRKDRMIDLSKKAASKIGLVASGSAKVKMRIIQ